MRETSYLASSWIAINNSQKQIVYTINATDMVDYLTYSLQGPAASNRTFTPNPPRPHKPTHIPISISPRPTQPPYEFPPRSCRRTSTWHAPYKCRACTGGLQCNRCVILDITPYCPRKNVWDVIAGLTFCCALLLAFVCVRSRGRKGKHFKGDKTSSCVRVCYDHVSA